MSTYQNDATERLFEVIAAIDNPEDCRAFFEDLCTIKEILDMSQRLDTAILLDQGLSYQKIVEKVKVSTTTIGRVSRALTYGSNGYRRVLDKMRKENNNDCQ